MKEMNGTRVRGYFYMVIKYSTQIYVRVYACIYIHAHNIYITQISIVIIVTQSGHRISHSI